MPVIEKSERALKASLAAAFKPLELCQRRYELRMERHDGDMVRDVVQEKLELELQSLGISPCESPPTIYCVVNPQ
jgi:hypothetical protein